MEETPNETRSVLADQRMKFAIGALIAALVIFLIGFLPPTLRARRLAAELERANARTAEVQAAHEQRELDLHVARLRGTLGEVIHETSQNNFGNAATRATAYFDAVQAALNDRRMEAASKRREVLTRIAGRRDEISADLARADAAARQKLADMYIELGQMGR